MVMSGKVQSGQNHNLNTSNKSFARVERFSYLGTTLINKNSIHEDITSRLKSVNACSHSMQDLLSPSLLSKNINIKTSEL